MFTIIDYVPSESNKWSLARSGIHTGSRQIIQYYTLTAPTARQLFAVCADGAAGGAPVSRSLNRECPVHERASLRLCTARSIAPRSGSRLHAICRWVGLNAYTSMVYRENQSNNPSL